MDIQHFTKAIDPQRHSVIELPGRGAVARLERELEVMKVRLRQALARERALAHQWGAFIQVQEVSGEPSASHEVAANRVANLTARQRQIMHLVLAGHPSKNIAADLGISQRTVENHRARIMKRTESKSLPALTQLALAAGWALGDKTSAPPRLEAPHLERADHPRKERSLAPGFLCRKAAA